MEPRKKAMLFRHYFHCYGGVRERTRQLMQTSAVVRSRSEGIHLFKTAVIFGSLSQLSDQLIAPWLLSKNLKAKWDRCFVHSAMFTVLISFWRLQRQASKGGGLLERGGGLVRDGSLFTKSDEGDITDR